MIYRSCCKVCRRVHGRAVYGRADRSGWVLKLGASVYHYVDKSRGRSLCGRPWVKGSRSIVLRRRLK